MATGSDLQAPVTRWATAAPQDGFPVDSIFLSAIATNPRTMLGYGTWAAFGAGRMLASFSAGDPDFGTLLGTGGAKTNAIANHGAHGHSVMSNVTVSYVEVAAGLGSTVVASITNNLTTSSSESVPLNHLELATGSTTFKILPPFITVYMWRRTA